MLFFFLYSNATYQRMLAQLAQSELAMEKSLMVHDMNVQEQANYQKLNREIGKLRGILVSLSEPCAIITFRCIF